MKKMFIATLLVLLWMFSGSFGRASPRIYPVTSTPIPTPNTVWTSGESGTYAPRSGMLCWGDSVGSYIGPVVVKYGSNQPSITIVWGGCEIAPNVLAEDRANWLMTPYPRIFTFVNVDVPTSTPTPSNTATRSLTATSSVTSTPTKTYTLTSTSTMSRTSTPSSTSTPSNTWTATNTRTASSTYTETSTPTETPTDTETPTETDTPTESPTLTPTFTKTWTMTRTFTSTKTSTVTRSNTKTKTPTVTRSNTRTRTATFTRSITPTLTILRNIFTSWDSRGIEKDYYPIVREVCWGRINGISDVVIYYRAEYSNPERIQGGCQRLPVNSVVDITNYWTRKTGRSWTFMYKP